jgi:hypothetical protein
MGPRGSQVDRLPAPASDTPPAPAAGSRAREISIFSRLLYALCGEDAVKAWRKKKYKAAYKTDSDYEGDDFWLQIPYLFLYLQLFSALVSLVIAAKSVDPSLPAWDQYTNFYALIVNSGIPTAVFSMLKMATIDERKQMSFIWPPLDNDIEGALGKYWPWWLQPLLVFPPLILLPPFLTHILPMMLMYCWIALPAAFALFLGVVMFFRDIVKPFLVSKGFREQFAQYFVDLSFEVSLRFFFIFFFHTLFNWGSLLYIQGLPITPQGYISVLVQDWHLRSQTQCFLKHAANSADGIVVLFSWF